MQQMSDDSFTESELPLAAAPPTRIRLDVMVIVDGPSGTARVLAIQYNGTEQRMTSKTVHDHVPLSDVMQLASELVCVELTEVLGAIGAF